MIVYTDTSALVKLFLQESGSEAMIALVDGRELATSSLSWSEANAAFTRRLREGWLTKADFAQVRQNFDEAWPAVLEVQLDARVQELIPKLCEKHPLRGGDAIQLASALVLHEAGLKTTFACADDRLSEAARQRGLPVASLA